MDARYPDLIPQGASAELIAEKYHFSRNDLDRFAVRSQERAAQAWEKGVFKKSIVPVQAKTEAGKTFLFHQDEHLRPGTTVDILAGLKPVFK